jgi:uncharacterized protein involved in outer membrane biogenesis
MRWKWIAGIIVILIIALMAAVYVLLDSYDYNKLKPRIARMVKDACGRELNLGGEVDLAIGFSPTLVVTDVAFANASWGSQPQMIRVEKLEAQVRLLALLHRDVQIRHISLAGVEVLLETDPNGKGNWDFSDDEKSVKRTVDFKSEKIDIDNIRIKNLGLSYRQGKTGSTTQYALASLDLIRKEAEDKLTLDLKADYNRQPVTISGKIGLIRYLLEHQRFPLELEGTFSNAKVKIEGTIDDILNLEGIDLKVQVSGIDLAKLEFDKNIPLPKTDEFDVTGHLSGSKESLALIDISGNLSGSDVSLAFNGSVGDLIALSSIDLKLKGMGKDLAEIGPLVDQKLPTTDQFAVEGRLAGSAKALSLREALGSAKRGSLNLTINGQITNLLAFSGMDLKLKGSGKDLAEVGAIIDQKLPTTDQFAVEARLTGSTGSLSLQQAQGSAKRGSLNLTINGEIENLLAFSGMDLKLKGSGKDLMEVGTIIDQKLPTTDQFAVQGRLTGSIKALSLREAQGNAKRGSLNLTLNGGIAALPALNGINFKVKASGKELAEIGPLVGAELPELGPFDMSGKLTGSAKAISLIAFSAMVDKSDFNGMAKVEVLKRPKFTVRLESSMIDFTTLMKSLVKDEKKPANKNKQQRRLFSDNTLPFDALKKVDADIVLKARNLHAKDARLEFGHLSLKLENSDFNLDRLEATYKKTKISGNLHIDPGSPPRLATNFLVQHFNLGDFLKETGKSDQVRAIVDIAAHGKSQGNSVNGLMANLDGAFGAIMGPGYLTKYLDLLSVDLAQKVIPIWGRHKKADEINCAVVQFDIKEGVATSQAFVFDTQIGVLSAEGDINLGTEKVNFLLAPKPKNPGLLSLSTKLRVSGTLMHPKVHPDTLALATKGAKALSFLAVGPLGLLAPFVHLGAHKKHPCDIQDIIGQLELNIPGSE